MSDIHLKLRNDHKYRVLMFSPAFAPFANAEAIVNSKLVLAMLEVGWEVDVISRKLAGLSSYDYGTDWVEPWLSLRGITHEISYPLGNRFTRSFDALKSAFGITYPLDGCRWALRAYKLAMKLHRKKNYDVVISRAFPQYAHIPAMRFSNKTGVPWIANWNDPWDFLRQPIVVGSLGKNIGWLNSYYSKKIAKFAKWHTFPSDKLRYVMTGYLGNDAENHSVTIPHVAVSSTYTAVGSGGEFKICYCGKLSKFQDPSTFLVGYSRFIDSHKYDISTSFHFAGIDEVGLKSLAEKYGIADKIVVHGCLGYSEAQELARSSTILLAIDPPDTRGILLTSKIVDYVQANRPLIAVTTKGSTIDLLLQQIGGGLSADVHSPDEISSALGTLFSCWKEGNLQKQYDTSLLMSLFCSEKVLSSYASLFELR